MSELNMFEKASKLKLRFATTKGTLAVEDLYDLSLKDLNVIAKALNKKLKEANEEDFLDVQSSNDGIVQLQFDIVLYILTERKNEETKREQQAMNREKKRKLLELLEKQQNNAMEKLTEEQIKQMITELE